ncbi:MAG: formylglycine-generating enzyme family protein [Polyangiaceae bacterium]|nr:formylglycine-generating enzyme family protein [Polyangiaceae bacterium]
MGAPESEFGYTKSQNQVTVTLTRPFALQQYELTQEQWIRFGWKNPSGTLSNGTGDCVAPECPVGQLTWFEAIAYANELSKTHVPPLEVCYELTGCSGTIGEGEGMRCDAVTITTPSVQDCAGFRLPTEAEWEFAARAGVTSAFYNGGITPQENTGDCFHEPALDSIAWYCDNAGPFTHPVGLKAPNRLGLHDMLGNAFEWVHSDYHNDGYGDVAVTDPFGVMNTNPERVFKGGGWNSSATRCRAAAHLHGAWWGKGLGVRLARTLAADEVW